MESHNSNNQFNMAVAFEGKHVFLLPEYADHINARHFNAELMRVSQLKKDVNLKQLLITMGERAMKNQVEILEEGFKSGHGHYIMFILQTEMVIGCCPYGFPVTELCVYVSLKPENEGRMSVISAYPLSESYYFWLKRRKLGCC